jgi:ribose transport system ATP-binding protein
VSYSHPRQAIRKQVAYVPGDRAREGLLLSRSILENIQLPSWRRYRFPLRIDSARKDADRVADDLNLVRASMNAPASSLSGGNAQKVVIGKWLIRQPKLLLLNDPTKGVDVGTKREFYNLLAELRRAGTAILFYSSDDEELLGLCDRVLVLHDGKIRAELSGEHLTHSELVGASMGTSQNNGRARDQEKAT